MFAATFFLQDFVYKHHGKKKKQQKSQQLKHAKYFIPQLVVGEYLTKLIKNC